MIRGAIFDADGTLLDSMKIWDTVGVRYLASIGVAARPGLRSILFPMTMEEGSIYMKEAYGLEQSPREIAEGINGTLLDFYCCEVRAKPGAKEFLEELRRRGVRITLATNTDRVLIKEGLSRTGLLSFLDEIYTCGELGIGKDQPGIFSRARDRMGTRTEDTWVFEDAVHCAQTAFLAGYKVAGVADAYSDQEELKKVCHVYLPDLTDFNTFYERSNEIK